MLVLMFIWYFCMQILFIQFLTILTKILTPISTHLFFIWFFHLFLKYIILRFLTWHFDEFPDQLVCLSFFWTVLFFFIFEPNITQPISNSRRLSPCYTGEAWMRFMFFFLLFQLTIILLDTLFLINYEHWRTKRRNWGLNGLKKDNSSVWINK